MSKNYENPWIFDGNIFSSDDIGDNIGFVYIIVNNINGRKYIGKKIFHFSRKVKNKRKKVESDWKKYYGSSDELKADVENFGADNFARTIIKLCKSKSECSYYETKFIFEYDCILSSDYYNKWVTCKITQKQMGIK